MNNNSHITQIVYIVLIGAAVLIITAAVLTFFQRERVAAFNTQSPTTCINGIVYFVDSVSNQVITHLVDNKTDKPKHCN